MTERLVWKTAYRSVAKAEGWYLYVCKDETWIRAKLAREARWHGRTFPIPKKPARFRDDEAAFKFVCAKADEGSEVHRIALAMIARNQITGFRG